MPRRRFELDDNVNKLLDKYYENHDEKNFDQLVNQALKCYLIHQLGYKNVKEALRGVDDHASKYIDESMRMSMGDFDNNY